MPEDGKVVIGGVVHHARHGHTACDMNLFLLGHVPAPRAWEVDCMACVARTRRDS